MLFGEYSIIEGSMALTMPFSKYSGHLNLNVGDNSSKIESNQSINNLYNYIITIDSIRSQLDYEKLDKDISSGLYFESDIPLSYGMGSSGAVCAALAREYSLPESVFKTCDLPEIRRVFSMMESFFHGRSSGIDPLTSFIQTPLLFLSDGSIRQIGSDICSNSIIEVFLIDSGIQSKTAGLVDHFFDKMMNSSYKQKFENEYIPQVNSTINEFVYRGQLLKNRLIALSEMQLVMFSRMITENMRDIWENGLQSGDYCLKLCGSGGGGYLLGFKFSERLPFEHTLIR